MAEQTASSVAAVYDRRSSAESRRGAESAPYRSFLSRAVVRFLTGLLWLYQKLVSPALHAAAPLGGCRFAPTCSHYAQDALREHGALTGTWLALRRLAKCGPWHPGGLDPVPPRKFSCVKVSSPISAAES